MVVACVAVLGKANNPLFLQTYNTQVEELKFHFIVHASLDIVEERLKEASNLQCYLGLLYPIEDYKVYGYITHTGIKFAVVVDDIEVKDQDVRQFFEKVHALYVATTNNPFYQLETPVATKRFVQGISRLATVVPPA